MIFFIFITTLNDTELNWF